MDAELIRRWNETVAPDDVVLHLGDLALGPIVESLPLTAQLHGHRFLVPGNHDRVSPATQTKRAIERFAPLYEEAGWTILPEVVSGTRTGIRMLASHYPYSGDTQSDDRHVSHRPVDHGLPLLHGHTHDRENGPIGHQFHVGVDAFGFAPIPMTLVDAWLEDRAVSSCVESLGLGFGIVGRLGEVDADDVGGCGRVGRSTESLGMWGVTLLVDGRYQEGTTGRDVYESQEVH